MLSVLATLIKRIYPIFVTLVTMYEQMKQSILSGKLKKEKRTASTLPHMVACRAIREPNMNP